MKLSKQELELIYCGKLFLTEVELRIWHFLKTRNKRTASQIASHFGHGESTTRRYLNSMEKKNVLKRKKRGQYNTWEAKETASKS